jgi:hypothetical protein
MREGEKRTSTTAWARVRRRGREYGGEGRYWRRQVVVGMVEVAPVRMVLRWMEIGLGFSESREGRGRSSWLWLEDGTQNDDARVERWRAEANQFRKGIVEFFRFSLMLLLFLFFPNSISLFLLRLLIDSWIIDEGLPSVSVSVIDVVFFMVFERKLCLCLSCSWFWVLKKNNFAVFIAVFAVVFRVSFEKSLTVMCIPPLTSLLLLLWRKD